MTTWNYTGKTLVSYKVWKQEERHEMAYRRGSNYCGWKTYVGDNPYEERFGDDWQVELAKSPRMKTKISWHCSIDLPEVCYCYADMIVWLVQEYQRLDGPCYSRGQSYLGQH
jgi:hypothetical protein